MVDGGEGGGVVGRRRLHHYGAVAEGHDADANRCRLLVHERPGARLRHLDATGLDVGGAHAVRHVEGDHRRALLTRGADGRRRAGQGDHEDGQGDDEEGERDVPPPRTAVVTPASSVRRPARSA